MPSACAASYLLPFACPVIPFASCLLPVNLQPMIAFCLRCLLLVQLLPLIVFCWGCATSYGKLISDGKASQQGLQQVYQASTYAVLLPGLVSGSKLPGHRSESIQCVCVCVCVCVCEPYTTMQPGNLMRVCVCVCPLLAKCTSAATRH